jgi:hypothetical protein
MIRLAIERSLIAVLAQHPCNLGDQRIQAYLEITRDQLAYP